MKNVFFACLLSLLSFGVNCAQQPIGKIEGSVRDLDGHPMVSATVYAYDTAKVTGRFVRLTTISDSNGAFVLANLPPGNYRVHAYKEADGYADTFFLFFKPNSNRAWRNVQVHGPAPVKVVLELGPKCASLKISIRDERGNPIGGGLTFTRLDYSKAVYSVGVNAESRILVPPVPLRFEVSAKGYESWESRILTLRPGDTAEFTVRLTRSNQR